MSYLVLEDGIPDFDKAVISFWFRVSKETLEAVGKQNDPYPNPRPRMNGIVPLVTFGPALKGYQMESRELPLTSYGDGDGLEWNGSEVTGGIWSDIVLDPPVPYTPGLEMYAGTATEEDPSHVGIYCQLTDDGVIGYLHIKLQLSDVGSGTSMFYQKTVHISDQWYCGVAIFEDENPAPTTSAWDPYAAECTEICYPGGGDAIYTYTTVDYTELFAKSTGGDVYEAGSGIKVEPDTWHHVLISFDISGGATSGGTVQDDSAEGCAASVQSESGEHTLSSENKMWIAFDDKNYDDFHLRWSFVPPEGDPNREDTFGIGPNGIAPDMNYFGYYGVAGGGGWTRWEGQQKTTIIDPAPDAPSYTTTGSKIKSSEGPFGIPCAPQHVGHDLHHVEMAEFMIFTGVTLDTSVEENRRIFITGVGKDGFQHPTNSSPIYVPFNKFAIGDPATWEPGADWPAYVPPLSSLDPSGIPSAHQIPPGEKPAKTALVDFTKCQFNWMMGRNLGTAKSKVQKVGEIKAYGPPDGSHPKLQPADDSGGGGSGGGV